MRRLFRWKYILPRLALVLLLLVFCEYGVGVILKYSVRQGGQAAVGAKVEVAKASASVLRTNATLEGIAVADPHNPMSNLLEADRLTLDFDSSAALRKKAVVRQGELTGLRFATPRETSGALPEKDPQHEQGGAFQLPNIVGSGAAKDWLVGVEERFTGDLQLESVRLAEELRTKWPAEYASLESRAKQLQAEIKQLGEQIKLARENPLRNVAFLQSVPKRITDLKTELQSVKDRLAKLPVEVRADRQAVLAARVHDEQLLREKLNIRAMDAESLSTYLLGDQLAAPVTELVGWLRWARRLAPSGDKPSEASRGVDVYFAGCRRTPNLLVESLKLSGAARLAGRPVEFQGQLADFTTQPQILGKPMLLSLTTSGAAPIQLRARVDRTGQQPVDEIVADCPSVTLPQLDLGKQDTLGLSVSPSTAALSLSLSLTGDRLAGDLQIVQQDVKVTPHVKASLGGVLTDVDLQRALARQLAQSPRLVTTVTLSGDLDHPEWKLWSTAGPALAEAMNNAVTSLANDRAKQLMAKGEQEVAEHLGKLDQEIAALTSKVTAALGEPAKALQALAGAGDGGALGGIGSRLAPMGSLFK
ncbi:MAG: TIGR03545 family protein [Planctomycetales bacterium]|nr:TIGR03545 family protein [Planctomycetales bacterium]